jgi:hypothetical protein
MWANLLCLLLLSNRARDGLAPLSNAVSAVLDGIVAVCTFCCKDDDRLEDLDAATEYLENKGVAGTVSRDTRPTIQAV